MGHLFLQAPGTAVTTSGALRCWVQTQSVSPPTWEMPWSWCKVMAQALLGEVLLGLALWMLSPGQGLFCPLETWLQQAGAQCPGINPS